VNGFSNASVTSDVDDFAADSFEMLDAFRLFASGNDNLYVFGELLWQPEGDVGLFGLVLVSEAVDGFDNDDDFVIDFLSAVDDLLFFDFGTDNVEPVGEKLSNILLEKVDALLELQGFFQSDDDLVERVEVVAVVAASAGEVHNRQHFLLPTLIAQPHSPFPLTQNSLHPASSFTPKHQGSVAVFVQPSVHFMNMFFLPGPDLFRLVVFENGLAGAG
jgi:hypothetical protein